MENIIAKLLQDFELGKMTRRQLIQSLAITATAASAVNVTPAEAAEGKPLNVTNINHVSYQVTDYAKTRDFYAGLFNMKVTEDDGKQCRLTFGDNILIVRTRQPAPKVDHIAYTLANWDRDKEEIAAEVKRRGLKIVQGDTKTSLHVLDPDGLGVQFGGLRQ
jgi:catechol 2,3-dioxygenase-like lactoylglutathione lyase family enzyme